MKQIILAVVLSCSLAAAQGPRDLTLHDAMVLARDHSRMLRASSARADAATAKADEAGATLLPSLRVEGSYHRLSDVDPFRVQLPILPAPVTISPTVLDNYAVRLSLQQPLFTGFRLLSNVRAARALAVAGLLDERRDSTDLDLAVSAAYWTLSQALVTQQSADENVARLESYLHDTENLMKAGMATRNDLLRVQVQLSNGRLLQIDAANDAGVARMSLNNIIGLPLDGELHLLTKPGEAPEAPGEAGGDLVAHALAARPDLFALKARVEASRSAVAAAQGGWWPSIFLTASYAYARPNPRYLPTKDEFKGTWDVGVTAQFDLWNWGVTAHQTDQARALLTQQENAYAQLCDDIILEVKRTILAVQRAREKVDVARLAVGQAEENVRSLRDKYTSGLATSTDLLDGSVALLQARTGVSGAEVELAMARARLARATGDVMDDTRGTPPDTGK